MKTLKKLALAIAFIALVASCQSGTDVNQLLANQETRKAIMDSITNDKVMSTEMMTSLMNSKNCKMAMMENHEAIMKMMKMMKENPDMMKGMICDMMEACKDDTAMTHSMCKAMKGNKEMMNMVMGKDKDKCCDTGDMDKMKGMEHKHKH